MDPFDSSLMVMGSYYLPNDTYGLSLTVFELFSWLRKSIYHSRSYCFIERQKRPIFFRITLNTKSLDNSWLIYLALQKPITVDDVDYVQIHLQRFGQLFQIANICRELFGKFPHSVRKGKQHFVSWWSSTQHRLDAHRRPMTYPPESNVQCGVCFNGQFRMCSSSLGAICSKRTIPKTVRENGCRTSSNVTMYAKDKLFSCIMVPMPFSC